MAVAEDLEDEKVNGRPTVHPWDAWTDGNIWKLVEGVDFDIDTESLRAQLYTRATRFGFRVVTRTGSENGKKYVKFQFKSVK